MNKNRIGGGVTNQRHTGIGMGVSAGAEGRSQRTTETAGGAKNAFMSQTEQNRQRAQMLKQRVNDKKENQIEQMNSEQIMNELKQKRLPTFGTVLERKDRLKKHYGFDTSNTLKVPGGVQREIQSNHGSSHEVGHSQLTGGAPNMQKKSSCTDEIEKIKVNREERRRRMEETKIIRDKRQAENEAQGWKIDVDFQQLVEAQKENVPFMQQHIAGDSLKINVCVKKRPIFQSELAKGEIDVVSCANPKIICHEAKYKVDGITKYINNQAFDFDNSFSHDESNEELYHYSLEPILDNVFNTGTITIFAYGQTGSGKTYTMQGLQNLAVQDLFERGIDYWQNDQRNFAVTVSMYEIYGDKIYDLLNNHEQLKIMEDKNQKIQIFGLSEQFVSSEEQILELIDQGNLVRTTHATSSNETSSRSHAVCQIKIQEEGVKKSGKLLLVDLAGSERAGDCEENDKERRMEGAEINKSLLGLKECVRAIDGQKGQAMQGQHVPFRQSKLTLVLRDSFLASEKVKIIMLACVCPGSSSADHTLNTLRYAERLKERGPSQYEQVENQLRRRNTIQNSATQASDKMPHPVHMRRQNTIHQKAGASPGVNPKAFYHSSSLQTNEAVHGSDKKRPLGGHMVANQTAAAMDQKYQLNQEDLLEDLEEEKEMNFDELLEAEDIEATEVGRITNKNTNQMKKPTNLVQQQMPKLNLPSSNNTKQPNNQPQQKQHKFGMGVGTSNPGSAQKQPNVSKIKPTENVLKNSNSQLGKKQSALTPSQPQIPQSQSLFQKVPMTHQLEQQNDPQDFMTPLNPGQEPPNDEFDEGPLHDNDLVTPQDIDDQHNIDFEEDDDAERLQAEENVLNNHLECVKQEAYLITVEGEVITKLENAMLNDENYDMESYLQSAEEIAKKKLAMYSELLEKIQSFKTQFGNEQQI